MKVNNLISSIYRGQWLLDVHSIESYFPMIQKLSAGETLPVFEGEEKAILNITDGNGTELKRVDHEFTVIPEGSIAHVYMIGEIVKYGTMCLYGSDEIVAALYKAQSYENVIGTVLHVDGPGGEVAAIGLFRAFKKDKTKPVVGLVDCALSAHFWAMHTVCDYTIADNDVSARFGSVGVVSSMVDTRPYYEELGFKFHDIYPPESKDKNQAFKLALEGKYDQIIKKHLSPIAIKFQDSIKEELPNLKDESGVLTGETFDADTSLGYNMIHEIGSFATALEQVRKLSYKYKINKSLNS